MNKSVGLQALEKPLASLPHTLRNLVFERLQHLTHYEPVIGIMGKTGVPNGPFVVPSTCCKNICVSSV
ncbi:hypothetical protein KLVA111870_17570 [Klebsiella variicola]|nr:hypothetical protein SB5387_02064 [Klebsiella variicola]